MVMFFATEGIAAIWCSLHRIKCIKGVTLFSLNHPDELPLIKLGFTCAVLVPLDLA